MSVIAEEFPIKGRRLGAAPSHLVFITAALSGREVRNPEREARRLRFNAAAGIKRLGEVRTLIAWHAAMEGQTYGFLLTDSLDFEATQGALTLATNVTTQGRATLLSGSGAGSTHQLQKWYTVGSRTYKRKLTRPKTGTVSVYFDGVLATVTTDYTINYATGVLTQVSGGSPVISWTGEFYVPVRFEQPELPLELILYKPSPATGVGEVPEVPLIEDIE